MICQSSYNSYDEIPEALRGEFEQKGAKWVLKADAIPGVGALFNPALYENEQRAITQAKNRKEEVDRLTLRNQELERQVGAAHAPGSVVLGPDDAKLWNEYTPLGTPKDLKKMKARNEELEIKVGTAEMAEQIQKVVKDTGLNHEVLADWAGGPDGKGHSFFTKDVTQNIQGKDTVVKVPFVKVETERNGKIEVTEHELLPYAKEKLPEWKYAALTAKPDGKGGAQPAATAAPAATNGVRLPVLGSAANKTTPGGGGDKRPVDKFNEERASRPSPFAKPTQGAATQ